MRRLSSLVRLYEVDNFLTDAECEQIVALAEREGMRPSAVSYTDDGGLHKGGGATGARGPIAWTSEGAWLNKSLETRLPDTFGATMRRVHDMVGMAPRFGEHLYVTRYRVGGVFDLHMDSDETVGRVATVLMYLRDVPAGAGGETVFPRLTREDVSPEAAAAAVARMPDLAHGDATGIYPPVGSFCEPDVVDPRTGRVVALGSGAVKVTPKRGRAVVWWNHEADYVRRNELLLHGGCPVRESDGVAEWVDGAPPVKLIAQRWIRWYSPYEERNFMQDLLEGLRACSGGG